MKPRISRNHRAVSTTLGVAMTPWPIRFTRDGPRWIRITAPARLSPSEPRFSGWRFTVMGFSFLIPYTTSTW